LKKDEIGIAADHGGYEMKEKIYFLLGASGHRVVDFGNFVYDSDDDYRILPFRWHGPRHPGL
jgi:ribose 5-phosphate isomerase RpiB